MQSPFTPGPWHHGVGNSRLVWSGTKIESKVVADCTSDVYPVNDLEQEANARLIAAAPDMLAALRALVAQILDYERVNNLAPNLGRTYCWDTLERAVSVIAKAEGK
jgi:hypothetical protein